MDKEFWKGFTRFLDQASIKEIDKRYQEIVADYNREKDRVTVEDTFAKLMALASSLDAEQKRAAEEGLTETELALFDLLYKDNISKADREKLKQASKSLFASLHELLAPMRHWTDNVQTQAVVETSILDWLHQSLPMPPFTADEAQALARMVYDFVWHRSATERFSESGSAV